MRQRGDCEHALTKCMLWAPVAARRATIRTSGPNLVPARMLWAWGLVQGRQNSSAAAPWRSPESCGTRNVPRNRAGKEQMLQAPRTHHAIVSVRDAGDSRFQKLLRSRSAALLQGVAGRGKFRGTARGSVAAPLAPARCVRLPARRWEDDADPSVWLGGPK